MQFRLGSIPVRIRGQFLFLALVLGARLERPDLIAVWVAVVLVSVLVHELGHALMGRVFGLTPHIELHGMGGTTSWLDADPGANRRDIGAARSIAISLAGPCAGFLLAGVIFLAMRLGFEPNNLHARAALSFGTEVNLYWGFFNLAPMLPLDGGNVVRGALNLATKGRGEKPARLVSVASGVLLIAYAAYRRELWLGGLGAFFTWSNIQAYRDIDARAVDVPLAQAVQKAYAALERHDGAEAMELLKPVIVPQASARLRAIALRVYAYALLIEGMWGELLLILEQNTVLIGAEEMARYAKTARQLGRHPEADAIDRLVLDPQVAKTIR